MPRNAEGTARGSNLLTPRPCLHPQIILKPLHDMVCLLRQPNRICSLLMDLLYSITAGQVAIYVVVL